VITLRPYQVQAVEAVYRHLRRRDDNPVVVIPTAGGKTPVMATICHDAVAKWDGRVLVLAHVKELLEQTAGTLARMAPELDVGIYSAGLRRRDTGRAVIVAGIQSVYRKACELDAFDLVLVDEAHLIPPDGDGMYRQFLADAAKINPHLRVIGLTATPFRMKSGSICAPDYFLNAICYEIGVKELIRDGYLCPLKSKAGRIKADTSSLHVRGGEFIAGETEALMDQGDLVEAACREIIEYTRDRKSCLIFASGIRHGRHIADVLETRHGVRVGTVFGDTLPFVRQQTLDEFRNGTLKYVVNVNVLTTGFDAPNIDCVAMLRPTMSPGLYYQMVGRGFRLHPDKTDCLVLDFAGNILRHGPVDQIEVREPGNGNGEAPAKECPQCRAVIAAGYAHCPDCGFEFPPPKREQHGRQASTAGILSGQVTQTQHDVQDVYFSVHIKRGAPEGHPRSMRVDYRVGFNDYRSEWICFEHTGYARAKAEAWWRQRSNAPVPETAAEAVALAEAGALCETRSITVRSAAGEKYDRIVGYDLGPKPPWREPGWDDLGDEAQDGEPAACGIDDDEVPF